MVNAFIEDSYKLVFPLFCDAYLNLDYDQSVNHANNAVESSGVLVNNGSGIGATSTTTIAVDTIDATTKFSIDDTVYDDTGAVVGVVSAVTATQITLAANNAVALSNDENLKKNITPTSSLRDRNIWSDDENVGIANGFVIEAVITPYDVNGAGSRASGRHGVLDSQKTPPYPTDDITDRAVYESVDYLHASNYLTQKMMLFHNQYLKFYLENTTSSSYNQPAEYKIKAELSNAVGSTATIQSDTVISAESSLHGYYDPSGYYNGMTTKYQRVSTTATGSNPTSTVAITSFNSIERNTKSTGQIVVSGDIANYISPVNATGSVTIENENNFKVDVNPVQETAIIKFGNQPTASDTTNVNNYIQLISESGGITTKWFARSTGTNGAALNGSNGTFTWPTGARQYNIGGNIELTATNFAQAVNGYEEGFTGSAASPQDGNAPFVGGNTTEDVTLTVALTGTTPNRKGDDSASLTYGSTFTAINTDGSGNTIAGPNFSGGANELVQGESVGSTADTNINYISITDSAGTTKNYMPSDTNTSGSTGTRTLDNGSTVSVVYFKWSGGNNNCATSLAVAINHANGHPSTITATTASAVVNLSHDITGTAGNSATIAKTNTADSVATISGANFTGGVSEVNATNTPYIQLIDNESSPTTKKYVPVKNGDALGNGNNGGGSIGDVSGGIAFQEGASATATANNLRIAIGHSNGHDGTITTDSAGSATINLTQNTIGANTTAIGLGNLPSNISITNFSGGATPDNYIGLTDAAGTLKKYKASTHEVTGTTDGTYVFYRAQSNDNTTATNLETAIDSSSGHNGTLITTRTNDEIAVKLNQAAVGSSAVTENVTGATATSFSTTQTNNVEVGSGEADNIGAGNKIYDSSSTLIGTVSSVSGDTIVLTATPATAITSTIYTDQLKEALYLEQVYKVSLVYSKSILELYLNNDLVKKATHTLTPFHLHHSDCKIGRGANNAEQFFGELFEISMHKGKRPSSTQKTLTPGYSDIMFYYTFGD